MLAAAAALAAGAAGGAAAGDRIYVATTLGRVDIVPVSPDAAEPPDCSGKGLSTCRTNGTDGAAVCMAFGCCWDDLNNWCSAPRYPGVDVHVVGQRGYALSVLPLAGGVFAAGTETRNISSTLDTLEVFLPSKGSYTAGTIRTVNVIDQLAQVSDGSIVVAGPDDGHVGPFASSHMVVYDKDLPSTLSSVPAATLRETSSRGVYSLAALPHGGLAAGTGPDDHRDYGTVDLWNASALRGGCGGTTCWDVAPYASLRTNHSVTALAALPGGGIAAGTHPCEYCSAASRTSATRAVTSQRWDPATAGTIVLFSAASVAGGGGSPAALLKASGDVLALLRLPSGALLAGVVTCNDTRAGACWGVEPSRWRGALDVFDEPMSGAPPRATWRFADYVTSLAALPGGDVAVGTEGGEVFFLNASTIASGAGGPYMKKDVGGMVMSLAAVPPA